MRILLIETSTERGVIAYGNQENILFAKELPFGSLQSKFLMPYLMETLTHYGFPPPVDFIGVGIGPGSYTGIRLGVSAAQSLAYAWKIPLVGVCSLDGFVPSNSSSSYSAIIDARIGGVYCLKGQMNPFLLESNIPQVVAIKELEVYLEGISYLVTPSARILQEKIKQQYPENAWIWEERAPSVAHLFQSLEKRIKENRIVISPGHLELLYLRDGKI